MNTESDIALPSSPTLPRNTTPVVHWWEILAIPPIAWLTSFAVVYAISFGGAVVARRTGYSVESIQQYAASENFHFLATQISIVAFYLLGFAAIFLFAKWRGYCLSQVYFNRARPRTLLVAAVSGVAVAVLASLSVLAVSTGEHVTFADLVGRPQTALQLSLQMFALVAVAPVVEEVYFRGVIFGWLRTKSNAIAAAILSAGLFSAAHAHFLLQPGVVGWIWSGQLFALGLLGAYWVHRHGTLWPAIAAHVSCNLVASTSLWLAV